MLKFFFDKCRVFLVSIGLWIALSMAANAQTNPDFTFSFTGQDTIFVGEECTGILDWGHPTTAQIISLNPANPAVSWNLFTISGGYNISSSVPAGTTVRVTYRLVDSRNVTTDYSFNIRVVDTIKPKFDLSLIPASVNIYCGDTPTLPEGSVTDNCTAQNEINIQFRDSAPFNFCTGGIITRTWSATDRFSNRALFSQTINVLPNNGPLILLNNPENLVLDCASQDAEFIFQAWLQSHGNMVTNGCGAISYTTVPANPQLSLSCNTPQSVTFIAKDMCNKTIAASAVYRLVDPNPPTLVVAPQNKIVTCDNSPVIPQLNAWLTNKGGAFYQDGCTSAANIFISYKVNGVNYTIEQIDSIFTANSSLGCQADITLSGGRYTNVLGHTPITFVFTDACGNSRESLAHFIALDRSAPRLVSPAKNMTTACDTLSKIVPIFKNWYDNAASAVGSDDCGFIKWRGVPSYTDALLDLQNKIQNACGNNASISVQFYLSDFCGNELTTASSAVFTIKDVTGPTLVKQPTPLVTQCQGSINDTIRKWVDSIGFASFSDYCSPDTRLTKFTFTSSAGLNLTGTPGVGPYPTFGNNNCLFDAQIRFIVQDNCGNESEALSSISIRDTIKPSFTSFPSDITIQCGSNISNLSPSGVDNCFAVLDLTSIDTSNQSLDTNSCAHYNYTLNRTWKLSDGCGNFIERIQKITFLDTVKPTMILPVDLTLACGSGLDVSLTGSPKGVLDACDSDVEISNTTSAIGTSCGSSGRWQRTWTASDACGNTVSGIQNIMLIDSIAPQIVAPGKDTIVYCQNEVEKHRIFAEWVNKRANAVISDACSEVSFFAAVPGSYVLNDQGTWPGEHPGTLDQLPCPSPRPNVSDYEVVDFVFYDDCKNVTRFQVGFEVRDTVGPKFVGCDSIKVFNNEIGTCQGTVSIFPPRIINECTGTKFAANLGATKKLTSSDPGNPNIPIDAFQIDFPAISDPLRPFVDSVILEIQIDNIDADLASEYFTILNENGSPIGVTKTSGSECGPSYTRIVTLNAQQLYEWAQDSLVHFYFQPNGNSNLAVNDICGETRLSGTLRYFTLSGSNNTIEYSIDNGQFFVWNVTEPIDTILSVGSHSITYRVKNCLGHEAICNQPIAVLDIEPPAISCNTSLIAQSLQNSICSMSVNIPLPLGLTDNCNLVQPIIWEYYSRGATQIPLTSYSGSSDISEVVNGGVTQFYWIGKDASGNADTCLVIIDIADITKPVAICKPSTVYVNPSGVVGTLLDPSSIDGGSTDNCAIGSLQVQPNLFLCNQVRTEANVTLTVTDISGNTDQCTTRIRIEPFNLNPLYSVGICTRDTLKLYANTPDIPGSLYTYEWRGPNNFISSAANPIRVNADTTMNGLYYVTVTGFGGCSATGVVSVNISPLISTPTLFAPRDKICEGSPIVLETTSFEGDFVYKWYRGIAPNGIFLDSTTVPQYNLILPIGTYNFYVQVSKSNCASNPSISKIIEVIRKPVGSVRTNFIKVCENGSLNMGTDFVGTGVSYLWTGPNAFVDTNQNIKTLQPVLLSNAGKYSLQVFVYGCPADPMFVDVEVTPLPSKPLLTISNTKCPGQDLILTVNNITNGTLYHWYHPNQSVITTSTNMLVLPNATNLHNGYWKATLVQNDCESPFSDSILVEIEQSYTVNATNDGPKCLRDSILLQATQINGATYNWTFNNQQISQAQSVKLLANPGIYQVELTTISGCKYASQTTVSVLEPPLITAISNTGSSCIATGDSLLLSASLFPLDDGTYKYFWTGPNFTSTFPTPIIYNFTTNQNGIYTLVVTNLQGCKSDPQGTIVDLKAKPPKPEITGALEYCQGDSLKLSSLHLDNGFTYRWITPRGNFALTGPDLLLTRISSNDEGSYSLVLEKNGCISDTSAKINIIVKPIPPKPTIFGNNIICAGDSIQLYTLLVPGVTYHWTGPRLNSQLSNPAIFPSDELDEGVYQLRISANGCFSEPANPLNVIINPKPTLPVITMVFDSICADQLNPMGQVCVQERGTLPGTNFIWYNAQNNSQVAGPSSAYCTFLTTFNSFNTGANEIYVRAELNGCLSEATLPQKIYIERFPNVQADAGLDLILCEKNEAIIKAQNPTPATGYWVKMNPNTTIDNPNILNPLVGNLQNGKNGFVYILDYNTCKAYSKDTIFVNRDFRPSAQADLENLTLATTHVFNVLTNDVLNVFKDIKITQLPNHGDLNFDQDGIFTYTPRVNFVGKDYIIYELCSSICPTLCDTALVTLQVGDDQNCIIPNIFTPNGDGVNDYFIIPCVQNTVYGNNELRIYNEWGDEVYQAKPYRNDWTGTWKQKDLPDGTYFYLFDAGTGDKKKSGFLVLKR